MNNSDYPKGSRENPYTIEEFDNYQGEWPGGYVKDWGYIPREATGTYNPSSSSSSSEDYDEWSFSSNSSGMSSPDLLGGTAIGDVIPTSYFRGYRDNDKSGCFRRCEEMLVQSGHATNYEEILIMEYNSTGRPSKPASTYWQGLNYIIQQLKMGRPVIAGVDKDDGTSAISSDKLDQAVDHYVLIVGYTGSGFHYFDPGTGQLQKGTSNSNILTIHDGYVTDPNNRCNGSNKPKKYTLTSVRANLR